METKQKPQILDPIDPRSTARDRISFLNATHGARGILFLDREEIDGHTTFTYGFKDLMVWIPRKQTWMPLPDKFYVKAPSSEIARQEFWARWKLYVARRFKLSFLRIETTSIERN